MKYTTCDPFFRQIQASISSGFTNRIYLVAIFDDYERQQIINSLLQHLASSEGNVRRFSAETLEFKQLGDHLQTKSLFGEEPIALVEQIEKMGKIEASSLRKVFPSSFGFLILSAKSKTALFESLEKEGVILDLLGEKTWEKEKRIEQQLEKKVKRAGKTFGAGALFLFLQRLDLDAGILEREVDKLLVFIGDRPSIERSDVEQIVSSSRTFTAWQMAEEWIWEEKGPTDESLFHPLLPALRSQLQLGLKIATLWEANTPREEWSQALPKVYFKTIEKRTPQAAKRGVLYFQRALVSLFDIELRSRTGSSCYGALLDLFRSKLAQRLSMNP